MSDTRPASVPDLSAHGQQIMKQFFQYHHLVSCTPCSKAGTLGYIANNTDTPALPVFQCTICKDKPTFASVEKAIQQAIQLSTRGATTSIGNTSPKTTQQPKKRSRVASDASNGSQKGTPIATPVKIGQPKNSNNNNNNSDGDIHSTINDKEIALLREMLLSLQDKFKNAELEHQLLIQQKQQAMITLQQQQQQQQDQDMVMGDDTEFPVVSGIAQSKYAHQFDVDKRIQERSIQRQNLKTLGVTNGRVLDIHYPTRNVVALLVHNDYRQQLMDTLKKAKVEPLTNFSPVDPSILTNTEYSTLSVEEKTRIATEKHNQRLVRALPFIQDYISKAVASFFLKENLITATQHEQFLSNFTKKAANSAASSPNTTTTTVTPSTTSVSQPAVDTEPTSTPPIATTEMETEL
ncbi:hypothetical protein BD560DRAFT_440475 [Blakeslea trispora]|nr:hypothetical protein BD560DRAFT_440475 [Blakeslea trispora]